MSLLEPNFKHFALYLTHQMNLFGGAERACQHRVLHGLGGDRMPHVGRRRYLDGANERLPSVQPLCPAQGGLMLGLLARF